MLTRKWRFRTLTLDAYESSQPLKAAFEDTAEPDDEATVRKREVLELHQPESGQRADPVQREAAPQNGAGDNSLSVSVHSSMAAYQPADGAGAGTEAMADGRVAATDSAADSAEIARREQRERLIGTTAIVTASLGHVARPGQGSHDSGRSGEVATTEVGVAMAVAPSEGFQTSTAMRDTHDGNVAGPLAAGPGTAVIPGSRAAGGGTNVAEYPPAVDGTDLESVSAPGSAAPGPLDRLEKAVVLREPARFAALKQKSLWRQLASAEAIYLTLFFTANVLILQLYLGACTAFETSPALP